MINIISKSLLSNKTSGPKKVVENFIKGLEELGYPYVINKRLDACQKLWIHDDTKALKYLSKLPNNIKTIIGPNLYILPRHIPANIDLNKSIYLHPSPWAVDFWEYLGFDKCPLEAWPTGIDTNKFKPTVLKKEFVLVYFKQRSRKELNIILQKLKNEKINYRVLKYGNYSEKEYSELLSKTKYIIWLGRQESQGIALEEALSMNIPIIVCDVDNIGHWEASQKEMKIFNEKENNFSNTTSAYYFNKQCGIKIKNVNKLERAINEMEMNLDLFEPRKYVIDNLSLKKQSKDLLNLYEKYFNLKIKDGYNDKILKKGVWKNNLLHKNLYKIKNLIKSTINKCRDLVQFVNQKNIN